MPAPFAGEGGAQAKRGRRSRSRCAHGGPSFAQQVPPPAQQIEPPAVLTEHKLVGLAVYSSNGEKLGQVTQHVGTAGGQPVRAELGGFLDVAPSAVVLPATMFAQKPDRIEVSMTGAEVKETLSKQQEQQQR